MQTLISVLTVFITTISWGQGDTTIRINDFNADGFADTLSSWYDGGTGFGGYYAKITDGRSQQHYIMDSHSCFCDIRTSFPIPIPLLKTENEAFLTVIKEEISPEFRVKADQSLKWMLSAQINYNRPLNDSVYQTVFSPKVDWVEGEIELPSTYSINLNSEMLAKHPAVDNDPLTGLFSTDGIMVYWANQHYGTGDNLTRIAQNKLYKIHKTKHGLIAETHQHKYKWIFITDNHSTGAPNKMRWESISRVRLFGNNVFLEQSIPPMLENQYFVIDIESGVVAQFKDKYSALATQVMNGNNDIAFGFVFDNLKNYMPKE